jgi:hypothetical protein
MDVENHSVSVSISAVYDEEGAFQGVDTFLETAVFNEGDIDSNVSWELLHHACMLLASVQLGQEDEGLAEALSTRADRLLEGLLSVRLQEDAEKSEATIDEYTITKGSA